jgi:hypothetical protein
MPTHANNTQEETSMRKRGGVSRSIDYLGSCLTAEPGSKKFPKEAALHDLAALVRITYDEARKGDSACGYFLGELLSVVGKKSSELARHNNAFTAARSKWKSARIASAKDSAVREYVDKILANAISRRRRYAILQLIPGAADLYPEDKPLSKLPELKPSKRSVDAWMDRVVYPELRRMKDQLDADPRIAKVDRFHDVNTKLQPSRLKKDARDAIRRVARLPKSYYFHSA